MILADIPLWFLRTFAILFGLVWGSFLNVVIYRVPRGMNVAFPASHCPGCGKPIAGYDNIPVLTYLILRGRTRCCNTKMSPRYPLVELLGGAVSLAIVETVMRGLPLDMPLERAGAVFLADFALAQALIAAAFIDAEHMFLPDGITLGGTVLGIATATLRGLPFGASFLGAAIGFVVVWLPLIVIYPRIRGHAGMGMGDAKLTLLAGAWFGWPGALFVLFAGAFQGTIGAIVIFLVKGKIEEPEAVRADREEMMRMAEEGDEEAKAELAKDVVLGAPPKEGFAQARMPFGPFLILAIFEFLYAGKWLMRGYASFIGF